MKKYLQKKAKQFTALPTLGAVAELKKLSKSTDIIELTKLLIMVKLIVSITQALFCQPTSYLRIKT